MGKNMYLNFWETYFICDASFRARTADFIAETPHALPSKWKGDKDVKKHKKIA